ncbi:FxsA family protein [Solicola sp. PLA-1-18]|uniref:FxsA family protein n=1 Tax=Solicola sp. PLA-1-18 TaxID=3380532 RepID=UPI003B7F3264
MRSPFRWRLAVAALLLMPVVELVVLIAVGQQIGLLATLGLLAAGVVVGWLVVRREGARALGAVREAARSGGRPDTDLSDRALVFVSGLLIMTPGFVTDVLGLLLWLPPVRRLMRRAVTAWAVRQGAMYASAATGRSVPGTTVPGRTTGPHGPEGPHGPDVVRGEVL